MLNYYYVPIKTVDSPYLPMNLNFKITKIMDINKAFEQLFDTVIKEIELNQHYGNLKMITLMYYILIYDVPILYRIIDVS